MSSRSQVSRRLPPPISAISGEFWPSTQVDHHRPPQVPSRLATPMAGIVGFWPLASHPKLVVHGLGKSHSRCHYAAGLEIRANEPRRAFQSFRVVRLLSRLRKQWGEDKAVGPILF